MDDELRKAAQDFADSVDGYENDLPLSAIRAKGALRAALAKPVAAPEQEPVASISVTQLSAMAQSLDVDKNQTGYHWRKGWNDALRQAMDYAMPVSTAPVPAPQREWQSLTENDIYECFDAAARSFRRHKSTAGGQQISPADAPDSHLVWVVERLLKEKNHG